MSGLLTASGLQAAENGVGVYLLGIRGPLAGLTPPPGLYFQNDFYYYTGKASPSLELPFNGKLLAGVSATLPVNAPTLLWSTTVQVLGGNLAFAGTLPIGGPSISADASLSVPPLNAVLSRNLRDSITTVGDPYLQGMIGWHSGNLHWTAGVGVNVPVGDYREGAIANIAFHRWATDVFGAVTYLNMQNGIDLSGAMGITFNGTNPATDYTTGTEFHLELAATQNLPNGLSFGVVSYFYAQLTDDTGSGAKLGPFRGRVAAVGGSLGYMFKVDGRDIATRLKVYREFDVENRLEGTAAFLTVALPLHVYAPPPGVGKQASVR
ncbi:MAG: transporter [Xanthobacteraceae bacterium]|nr:MAG: transporter [Xanthobacteraceae bacterium]